MGKKVITMSLSEKSIQNAIRELRAYKNSLTYKCQLWQKNSRKRA